MGENRPAKNPNDIVLADLLGNWGRRVIFFSKYPKSAGMPNCGPVANICKESLIIENFLV